jgi:hypothetical protein
MSKNLVYYLSVATLLIIFTGCKKESKSTSVPEQSVTVIAYNPQQINTLKGATTTYEYKLSGAIIAPGIVKFKDHGFIINNGSANASVKSLGPGSKIGYIETDFTSIDVPLSINMVVMYIVFETGDSVKSNYSGVIVPPVAFAQFNVAVGNAGHSISPPDEIFVGDAWNYDTVNFYFVERGIEFEQLATYTGTYNFSHPDPGFISDPHVYNYMNMTIPQSSGTFATNTSYVFRMYFVVMNKQTNAFKKFYSNQNSFVSQP